MRNYLGPSQFPHKHWERSQRAIVCESVAIACWTLVYWIKTFDLQLKGCGFVCQVLSLFTY